MSELTWAGDQRRFRLGIDELLALQDKLDAGPAEIAGRLREGAWRVQDLQEIFRIGLIGGGLEPKKAKALIDAHIVPGRLASHVLMAWAIVANAIHGDEADPVGKPEAETEAPIGSPQPPSTETAS
ncbi:gene transfer agent family protein [Bradyrhizobium japonicum]|uniref:gene transfer agent family protein n=1 Tax=Bradyrhizobium japonicum TaxID=375 RepID=UPI00271494FC|nr:gene transfer agent family protein [Bradyrhizobium japonicum]WLB14984.1 gene transfer agent family protein [Bradyrhizobium japonicum]